MENAILAAPRATFDVMKICNRPMLTEERGRDAKSTIARVDRYSCAMRCPSQIRAP